MTEPAQCDAHHVLHDGVRCDADAGHRGLHRHGARVGRVVFWDDGAGDDLMSRAELMAELAALRGLGCELEGEDERRDVEPALPPRLDDFPTIEQRLARRARRIADTLFPPPRRADDTEGGARHRARVRFRGRDVLGLGAGVAAQSWARVLPALAARTFGGAPPAGAAAAADTDTDTD